MGGSGGRQRQRSREKSEGLNEREAVGSRFRRSTVIASVIWGRFAM